MRILLTVCCLLFATHVVADEPKQVCQVAEHIKSIQTKHMTIADPDLIKSFLVRFNAIEPKSEIDADTLYVIERPNEMIEIVLVKGDCAQSGLILPKQAFSVLMRSLGEES